jgi:hypothetical protein
MHWYEVWLFLSIGAIKNVFFFCGIALILSNLLAMLVLSRFLVLSKRHLIIGVSLIVLGMIIPSKRDVAIIYILPKAVNNAEVQKLPNNVLSYVNRWLDDNTSQGDGK